MAPKRKSVTVKTKSPKKSKLNKSGDLINLLPPKWYENNRTKTFIGAHVSITGGLYNAVLESASIGGQAFGLFLCNQRTWNVKQLTQKDAEEFIKFCSDYEFPTHLIVPHSSYLINCGQADSENRKKSIDLLLDGVRRCDMLNIDLYNFHPGSTLGKISAQKCCENIADAINYVHDKTERATIVIENMCKQGNTVGGDFKEIKAIIDKVKNKDRVGVCLDTCHAFAAGYDLSTEKGFNKMIKEFDEIIDFKYLKALHLNDSKGKCGSHLDRHENIGKGFIGIEGIKRIVNEPKFKNKPMILETPFVSNDIYRDEIKTLYEMID